MFLGGRLAVERQAPFSALSPPARRPLPPPTHPGPAGRTPSAERGVGLGTSRLRGSCQGGCPNSSCGGRGGQPCGPVQEGTGPRFLWLGRMSAGEAGQRLGPCVVSAPREAPGCLVIQQVAVFQLPSPAMAAPGSQPVVAAAHALWPEAPASREPPGAAHLALSCFAFGSGGPDL